MVKYVGSLQQRFIFFGRNSGVHGLNHLFRKNAFFLARLFWFIVIVISACFLYLIIVPVIQLDGGISFTPNTVYLNWTTTFPAVTVCDMPRKGSHDIKARLTARYPDLTKPLSYDQLMYLIDLLYGRGKCSKSRCLPCGSFIACDVPWRKVMEDVHRNCEELISDCYYTGERFPCCKSFHSVDSEYGPCYSFNTLQNKKSLKERLFTVNRTIGPGELRFRLSSDATISIHSSEELSTNNLDSEYKFLVPVDQNLEILFSMVEMDNEPFIKDIAIAERGCRFPHEVPDEQFHTYPVYSFGACKLARSTDHSFEHCGCVAPIRDLSYEKYYCNFTGFNCLAVHEGTATCVIKRLTCVAQPFTSYNLQGSADDQLRDEHYYEYEVESQMKLGIENAHDDGKCLQSCVKSDIIIIHARSLTTTPEDNNEGHMISVKMSSLPTLRYQREQLRTNLEFVVSMGGMAGLFFSASVLSVIEIFYLILRKPTMNYGLQS